MAQTLRQNTLTDQNARPIAGANVYVYNNTGAPAALTSDGTTPLNQPVVTDNFGNYQYYADTGLFSEDIFLGTHRIFKQTVPIGTGADVSTLAALAASGGSALVGTTGGYTVQQALDTHLPLLFASIATLRANGATGAHSSALIQGYYSAADLGGGIFHYDSTDTTSADNGGTIIVDASNRRWKRWLPDGALTPQMFGCKCDGSTDDTTNLQAMFAACTNTSGNYVRLIAGQCLTQGNHTIANPVTIEGVAGQVQSGGMAYAGIVVIHATNNLFNITHSQANSFRSFGIRAGVTRTGGADFVVTGDGVNQPLASNWFDVSFNGSFTCISIANGKSWSVTNCNFFNIGYGGAGYCIYYPSTAYPDSGDNAVVGNTFISGVSGTTNYGLAAIYLESTFAINISDNKFFGFQYGIQANVKNNSGDLIITANSFEQQAVSHIDIRQGVTGKTIGNLIIGDNEFSQLTGSTPSVNFSNPTIYLEAGAAAYILNAVISGNVFNDSGTNAVAVVNIADGTGVVVQGNVFNLYSQTQPWCLQTGGNATNVGLLDNTFNNMATSQRYHTLNASTLVRDNGLQFADVGAWANGSQAFVTNGTAGTPLTGAGTGSMAFRINGAWKGI